jgi:hypothetical protein
MAHSLSFLLSSEAATARMAERKPAFVVHAEVAPYTDAPLTELDAENRDHAYDIARTWLTNGRAVSAGIRRVRADGTLGEADILDLSDFEDELAEETQSNLNRVMSQYGLAF